MILNECMTETCRSQTKSVLQVGSTMCSCTRVSSCFESVQYSKLQLNVRWCTVHRVADIRSQLNILKLQLDILCVTHWCTVHHVADIRSQLNIQIFISIFCVQPVGVQCTASLSSGVSSIFSASISVEWKKDYIETYP